MSEEELVRHYYGLAVAVSREFYVQGADAEDLRQEALFGLWKGIRDFRPELGVPAAAFYALCIRRQVISAVKTGASAKHAPLTASLRHGVNEKGESVQILDLLGDEHLDPAAIAERNDLKRRLEEAIATRLSPMERTAIEGIRDGRSYVEIEGCESGRKAKWVDNALQRARNKLALEVAA